MTVLVTSIGHAQSANKDLKPRQLLKSNNVILEEGKQYKIIIKFMDEIKCRFDENRGLHSKASEVLLAGKKDQLESLKKVKDIYGIHFSKTIDTPEEKIQKLIDRAEKLSGEKQPDLAGIITLNLDDPGNIKKIKALIGQLEKMDIIEYIQVRPHAPHTLPPSDITPETADFVPYQTDRGYDPGLCIDFAHTWGYTGDGIRVTDCEWAWNPDHEDLEDVTIEMESGQYPYTAYQTYIDHGTAVLGILAGDDNDYGVTGICPDADFFIYPQADYTGTDRRDTCLTNALADSEDGDIVLVEIQGGDGSPIETDSYFHNIIKTGVAAGVIVVAAAGNEALDLDSSAFATYMSWEDTGAIIVGAGTPDVFHSQDDTSTYGSRVNVQGWGSNVVTTGYGDYAFYDDDVNQTYTNTFGGTSAASAQVAGACAVLQSAAVDVIGTRLTPAQMKKLLITTGIRQEYGGHIGPLVNLQRAIWVIWSHDNGVLNYPPIVDAGEDAEIYAPNTVSLSGSAVDDTIPENEQLTYTWSKQSGPGTATFANANAASTTVSFSQYGTYYLRLVANDSEFSAYDDILITYRLPGEFRILYLNNNVDLETDHIEPWFQVENTGTATINLEDVTIKYWYTREGTSNQSSLCYYAPQVGSANVNHTAVPVSPALDRADYCFQIGFTSEAGSIDENEDSGDIKLLLWKTDWSDYTQGAGSDYSYIAANEYYPYPLITGYIGGVLIFGTEPE